MGVERGNLSQIRISDNIFWFRFFRSPIIRISSPIFRILELEIRGKSSILLQIQEKSSNFGNILDFRLDISGWDYSMVIGGGKFKSL